MFRKLVGNLSFSPALVGQLGFYAKRLRKEEFTRRLGLVFTALALVVQSFAVFSPPESANAADRDAIIYQSLRNKGELLQVYDQNRDSAGRADIQQIYTHYGITRQDIANATQTSVRNDAYGGSLYFQGRTNAWPGRSVPAPINGTNTTTYFTKWFGSSNDVRTYDMLIGKRAVDGRWFAIMLVCGNIVFQGPPTTPAPKPQPAAACQGLTVTRLSRDKFTLTARASTTNGASVHTFTYTIVDKSGKDIIMKTIQASGTTSTFTTTVPDGNYTANVSVLTSEGRKVSNACSQPLTVVAAPKPQPVASCTGLTVSTISRTEYTAVGSARTANGATIKEYVFITTNGSGKEVSRKTVTTGDSTARTNLTFSDGNYQVKVLVRTSVGEKTNSGCEKDIVVSPAPTAVCSRLTATSLSRTQTRLTATSATTGGASVTGYTYIIRDSKGKEVKRQNFSDTSLKHEYQYTFSRDGKYTAEVIAQTSVGSKSSQTCKTAITVSPKPRCVLNPNFPYDSPECKPCVDEPNLWYKDEDCSADFVLTKSVRNITQNKVATETTAKPNDVIEYTLTVKNTGLASGKITMKDDVTDSLQYADLVTYDNGKLVTVSDLTKEMQINWPEAAVAPSKTLTKKIQFRVKNDIPSTAQHASALNSYDCTMTNVFGNTTAVDVECPSEKVVEQVVTELPRTGMKANLLASGVVAALVVYFYARSRQLKKEVRLIRHDLNAGTI